MEHFDETYKDNYRKLLALSLKITSCVEDSYDVIQEVFVDYYVKMQSSNDISDVRHWLIRATINKSIDCLRKRKKTSDFSEIETLSDTETDKTDDNHRDFFLAKAMEILNNKEKELVALYSEGFSYMEISEILNIKFNSVGKKLSRSLDKIRKNLKTSDL